MPIVAPRAETGRKTAEPRPAARVVLSHPGNAPFVQHAARALEEAGLLSAYVTTFVYQRDSALGRSLRGALSLLMRDADRQLSRRVITEVSHDLVRSHPLPEIIRMASAKSAGSITTDRVWEVTEKWFDRLVARQHLDGVTAAYAYEHAALATFTEQERRGGLCVDDCVEGLVRLMASDFRNPLNLGTDELISVDGLVKMIAGIAGKKLRIRHDISKPQGVRGRNSDNTLLRKVLGWEPSIMLEQGLAVTYRWIEGELSKAGRIPAKATAAAQ